MLNERHILSADQAGICSDAMAASIQLDDDPTKNESPLLFKRQS